MAEKGKLENCVFGGEEDKIKNQADSHDSSLNESGIAMEKQTDISYDSMVTKNKNTDLRKSTTQNAQDTDKDKCMGIEFNKESNVTVNIVHEESGIFVDNDNLDVTSVDAGQVSQDSESDSALGLRKNNSDLSVEGEKSPSTGKSCSDLDISECTCDTQTDSGVTSGTNSASDSSNYRKTLKVLDAKNGMQTDNALKYKTKNQELTGNYEESESDVKVLNDNDKNHVQVCDNDKDSHESKELLADINCDKAEECDISDCMPTSLDTEDSDPIGSYDVAMATVSNSEGEQNSESIKIKKNIRIRGKRKYRIPRIKSDSDTESDTTENVDMNTGENLERENGQDELSDDSDFSADHFDDIGDEDDDDNEESEKKKSEESKSDSEEEEESNRSTKYKHTWKALYDLRSREYGSNNRTPPAVFREKVHGSVQMVQRFNLQYKMEYHEGCVNALHFNRIGTLLASGSDDLNIVLWNWIRNRPALVYDSGHRSNVFQAKFMPFSGDCHVVSCARDGQIRLGELSLTGVCKGTKKLAQHKGAAHKLALELDSPHVFLSCGEDAMVFEVDLRQEKPNKLVQTKENEKKVPLYSINSNPVNSFEFCVGGRDHYIRVYDKRKISEESSGLVKKYCPHKLVDSSSKANVTCAVYSYNGTEILGSYNDDDIYSFSNLDSDGAEYIHKYGGHRNNATVKGVNYYGPRSEFVVSGSDCGHIYLWDRETEDIVQFLPGDEGGVINVLEPHPFAPILATSGLDHDVKVWVPTEEEPTQLKNLKKTIRQNRKEREEERLSEPRALEDMIDGHMLYYLMRQIHRARRRNEPDEEGSSSSSSEFDSDDSDDPPNRVNCAQS